jgi:hypothetical protein
MRFSRFLDPELYVPFFELAKSDKIEKQSSKTHAHSPTHEENLKREKEEVKSSPVLDAFRIDDFSLKK